MKCVSCGCELPDGSQFCIECGAKQPQNKLCPKCHTELPLAAKFCLKCGFNFNEVSNSSATSEISMGDKNVVAGDIIGKKEEYNITGNATIIKNEDETKKVVTCSLCGKNLTIINTHTCPSCNRKVCTECFNNEKGICNDCLKNSVVVNEKQYTDALKNAYEDGIVSLEEREQLKQLQNKLQISSDRASELELKLKTERVKEDKITTVEQVLMDEAINLYYGEGETHKAFDSISKVYARHQYNEKVLNIYLPILGDIAPEKAKELINKIHVDIPISYITMIDLCFATDLTGVERSLDKAEKIFNDNFLVKTRRACWLFEMYNKTKDDKYKNSFIDIINSFEKPKTKLELTWLHILSSKRNLLLGKETISYTKEYCEKNNIFFYLINKEDSEVLYRKAFIKALEDGTVDITDKYNLLALQHKLGLSDDRVKSIESEFSIKRDDEDNLASIDEVSLHKAEALFYEDGKIQQALDIVKSLSLKYKGNDRVLTLYVMMLSKTYLGEASKLQNLSPLLQDIVSISNNLVSDLSKAEEQITVVTKKYPDNFLIHYLHALWLEQMFYKSKSDVFIVEMENLAQQKLSPVTKLERSLKKQIENKCISLRNYKAIEISKEQCVKEDIYYFAANDFYYIYTQFDSDLSTVKLSGAKVLLSGEYDQIIINKKVDLFGDSASIKKLLIQSDCSINDIEIIDALDIRKNVKYKINNCKIKWNTFIKSKGSFQSKSSVLNSLSFKENVCHQLKTRIFALLTSVASLIFMLYGNITNIFSNNTLFLPSCLSICIISLISFAVCKTIGPQGTTINHFDVFLRGLNISLMTMLAIYFKDIIFYNMLALTMFSSVVLMYLIDTIIVIVNWHGHIAGQIKLIGVLVFFDLCACIGYNVVYKGYSSISSLIILCSILGIALIFCLSILFIGNKDKFGYKEDSLKTMYAFLVLVAILIGAAWIYGYNKYTPYTFIFFIIPLALIALYIFLIEIIIYNSPIEWYDDDGLITLVIGGIVLALAGIAHFVVFLVTRS